MTYVTYILDMVAKRELQFCIEDFILAEDLRDLHTGHAVIPPYE